MRMKSMLCAALGTLLLASAPRPATAQAANQFAASPSITAPSQPQADRATEQSAPARLAWYADPIILAFALAALFAAIDIGMLFSKQNPHGRKSARA